MNREEAKQYMLENPEIFFGKRDKSKKGYVCPICGSGEGKKGTGVTATKDKKHFTCWAGCFTNSDIFDIIGIKHGITSYNEKLKKAAEYYNINIENSYSGKDKIGYSSNTNNPKQTNQQVKEKDYTELFLKANKNINNTDYHRGLSLETLNKYKIGFIEEWRHPKAPTAPTSPRLIIPTSEYSYLARDTRKNIPPEQEQYSKSKVGQIHIFNIKAMEKAHQPIFVVEGELDALSIIEVGGEAIALGSISYINKLLEELNEHRPIQPLIISLDNDERGWKASKKLEDGLNRLNIPYYLINIANPYKDANEALNSDRKAFKEAVIKAENIENEKKLEKLRKEAVLHSLNDYIQDIAESRKAAHFSTGFKSLDKILGGGLFAGLYVVGAISSLGKTTFCLQIADTVAAQGQDVLIFSLEMARNELIAKSVSRFTLIKDLEQNQRTTNAKSTRGILSGKNYEYYSQKERKLIEDATETYKNKCAANIYIIEGRGEETVKKITSRIIEHAETTKKPPVVIIDYLQIISPSPDDRRATDKQIVDRAITELKRVSRDYNIPIVGISSFNRENYTAPVGFSSFKESGGVEYSADVLIGLQYFGMDYKDDDTKEKRPKRIRDLIKEQEERAKAGKDQDIQVKVLKNRNGIKGDIVLKFYPVFNYYKENTEETNGSNGGWKKSKSNYIK